MPDLGNELFLLMVNLSQYNRESTVMKVFVESLTDLYPELEVSYSHEFDNKAAYQTEISTRENHFGFLHLQASPSDEQNKQLQNAAQMVAVILQKIKQNKLLHNEKQLLRETVENRTRELKESEERFRVLFQQNSSVLMLVDPENGDIHDVNNRAAGFYGYSVEQLRSMNINQISCANQGKIEEEIRKASSGEKNYFIFTHRMANGEVKDVELFTGRITIENKTFIYSTIHDITEQSLNRRRLQKGEAIAKTGHWEIDLNSRYVYSSKGARKIYGLEKDILSLDEIQKIPLKTFRSLLNQALHKLIESGEPYDIEFRIRRPNDGKFVDIHSVAEYHKERNTVFGIIQDITERKETDKKLQKNYEELETAEEELRVSNEELMNINHILEEQKEELKTARDKAQESDRLKSAFLANMSHEIRTPMNGIMGFSQILKEKEYPRDKQKSFLNLIHSRTRHLLQIINDIVDISKIEANQLTLSSQSFYLNDVLKDMYSTYQNELENNQRDNIELRMSMGLEHADSYMESDEQRIRQILHNLLSNAVKFTDAGTIEFGYEWQKDRKLLFFVSDTGIGIPAGKHESVFERFRQLDDSSSRVYEGTGLGLTISRNLVALLGGKMWVDSEWGEGATFYFIVPYQSSQKVKNEDTEDDSRNAYCWKDNTFLIIEDDPTSLFFLKEIFQSTEARVIICETGAEALKAFEYNAPIDLILLDIRLPDISGLEIAKKIREKNADVPIIAQTAHAMGDDREKCIRAGATDYIAKPTNIHDLLSVVNRYM